MDIQKTVKPQPSRNPFINYGQINPDIPSRLSRMVWSSPFTFLNKISSTLPKRQISMMVFGLVIVVGLGRGWPCWNISSILQISYNKPQWHKLLQITLNSLVYTPCLRSWFNIRQIIVHFITYNRKKLTDCTAWSVSKITGYTVRYNNVRYIRV